ncbi:MAG: guanylate kinase [Bacteroidales bacterium]|nr:guanylate kinase [Bacteroidales bacterium]
MKTSDYKKVVIFSAPSGSGKTTIVHRILEDFPMLEFSVSACSRKPRANEVHGKDYYFLPIEEFREKIKNQEFLEWEEVYPDHLYGTLKSEIDRIWTSDHAVIFDVDVVGGTNLKRFFDHQALSIFVMPPSLKVLEERLLKRGTESPESLKKRIEKAEQEMAFAPKFDLQIVNDELAVAVEETKNAINKFLHS